jgi:hypothetical protein
MRELEGRAEALAGTFNAQHVANNLWAASVFFVLRDPAGGSWWVHTVKSLVSLVSLGKTACFTTVGPCQLHQFFVWCSVEPRLGVEAINDMQSLKQTCCSAFEVKQTNPSGAQQQASETLRRMGLKDEFRCPKSGYSIDKLVHERRSSSAGSWALEFDGPWHFLVSGAPTGGTLLKRRHLELLGHTLVSVPYWEWDRCQRASEKEQYRKSKLRA